MRVKSCLISNSKIYTYIGHICFIILRPLKSSTPLNNDKGYLVLNIKLCSSTKEVVNLLIFCLILTFPNSLHLRKMLQDLLPENLPLGCLIVQLLRHPDFASLHILR